MNRKKHLKELDPGKYTEPLATILRAGKYLHCLFAEFQHDHCMIRASSLAFNTLLAAVPLLAFVFSLFTAFGDLAQIQAQLNVFLLDLFLPARQEELTTYLDQFIENSRALGTVGLLIFALTSILLLNTINENINAIWGSKTRRNFVSRFTTYTSVIVFGSLLIAGSFALTRSVRTIFNIGNPAAGFFMNLAIQVSPFLFMFLTLLIVIAVVPTARIAFSSACLGACAGSLLWNLSKVLFVRGTNYAVRASIMYGSLAAIPIFLIWMYITWLIILLALEITFLHQYRHNPWTGRNLSSMEPVERITFGLDLFFTVADRFRTGSAPPTVKELAGIYSATMEDARRLVEIFQKAGYIHPIRAAETGYVPARPLETVLVRDIIQVLFGTPSTAVRSSSSKLMNRIFISRMDALDRMSVLEALEARD